MANINSHPSANAWHHSNALPHRSLVVSNAPHADALLQEVFTALPNDLAQRFKDAIPAPVQTDAHASSAGKEYTEAHQKAPGSCPVRSQGALPTDLHEAEGSPDFARGTAQVRTGKPHVMLPASQIRKKQRDLEERALIGLLAGPRPPADTLRNWIRHQWGSLEAEVELIQALPKGHYLFVFKTADMAFSVLSHGQWVIRSSPLSLFKWYKDFNPEVSALVNYPVWVELPNLPMHYQSHLAEIGAALGKVLGGRRKANYIPSWHPQILVEMDISVELPSSMDILTDDGELYEQELVYKYLPDACFHCGDKSHFVRNCPIKFPPAPQPPPAPPANPPETDKDQNKFTEVNRSRNKPSQHNSDRGKEKIKEKGKAWQPNRFSVLAPLTGFDESDFIESEVSESDAEESLPSVLETQVNKMDEDTIIDLNLVSPQQETSNKENVPPESSPAPMEVQKDNKRAHPQASQKQHKSPPGKAKKKSHR